MPRTSRKQQWTEAACYHVINRGHNRETVFADDEDRRYFLGLLARYRQRMPLRIYHYCLMSNHFHLLLEPEAGQSISRILQSLTVAHTWRPSPSAWQRRTCFGRVVSRVPSCSPMITR